jgi:hypothetical protein
MAGAIAGLLWQWFGPPATVIAGAIGAAAAAVGLLAVRWPASHSSELG